MPELLKIFAITRKPKSASFEQRVRNYIKPLQERGIEVNWCTLAGSLSGQRRVIHQAARYDGLWWHRHLLSAWTIRYIKGLSCPLVFDFDDPLSLSSRGGGRRSLTRQRRFAAMLKRSDAAFAASSYLRQLALPYNARTIMVPMSVDLPLSIPHRADPKKPIELLWIGQRSTQIYLEQIRGVLEQLGLQRQDVRLRLVAHEPMSFGRLPVDFRRWSKDQQVAAMKECDIGLCPMPDTPWTRGKCPYKVLQYMSYAMVWIGSAVGQNVVTAGSGDTDQIRGFCAADDSQWLAAIQKLVGDAAIRRQIGLNGRSYVAQKHSRQAVADHLAQAWRQITGR